MRGKYLAMKCYNPIKCFIMQHEYKLNITFHWMIHAIKLFYWFTWFLTFLNNDLNAFVQGPIARIWTDISSSAGQDVSVKGWNSRGLKYGSNDIFILIQSDTGEAQYHRKIWVILDTPTILALPAKWGQNEVFRHNLKSF